MYDLYKPLRNYLRQFPKLDSLYVAFSYFQYLQFGVELPKGLGHPKLGRLLEDRLGLFEWEIELLVREIVLNCPPTGTRTLRDWSSLATAINHIKHIENEVWSRLPNSEDQILWEMHRIAHRQFPWQKKISHATVGRYFKIFSHDEMAAIVQERMRLPPALLYRVGLGLSGHFLRRFAAREPFEVHKFEVKQDDFNQTLSTIAATEGELFDYTQKSQSYDINWAYAFNPLRRYPLIRVPTEGGSALICPIPNFLLERITDGIYYELADHPKFANAFGPAFEAYVGSVLHAANADGKLTLITEHFYGAKTTRKRTTDWIAQDSSGTMFLECKTKRLVLDAKIDLNSHSGLLKELDKMAGFITQLYKTVNDAIAGKYERWKPNGKPLFPMVVTLDNWRMFRLPRAGEGG